MATSGGLEAEGVADGFFVGGLEVAEGADGAGELADAEVFGGGVEAGEVALHLGVPEEELEAEGGGFGVDAVGAADGRGVLELEGTAEEDLHEPGDAVGDEGGRLGEGEGLRGVDDIGGGEAVVKPAGGVAAGGGHVFCDGLGEGEDVVTGLLFDGVDAIDGEGGLFAEDAGGFEGDNAGFGEGVCGGELYGEPVLEFRFFRPDFSHLRACITGNHEGSSAL